MEAEEGHESDDDYKYKSTKNTDYDDVPDEDDFQPRKSETPTKKTPTKKIDLGAAASYKGTNGSANVNTSSGSGGDGFADFAEFSSSTEPQKVNNDLADLMGGSLSSPVQSTNTTNTNANVDLFGDFSTPGI